MTDAEARTLAQIERQLAAEAPELRRLFDAAGPTRDRRGRRLWERAGVLTVVISLGLLGCGLGLGLPGLAVSALCPPIAFGVLFAGSLLLARRV